MTTVARVWNSRRAKGKPVKEFTRGRGEVHLTQAPGFSAGSRGGEI